MQSTSKFQKRFGFMTNNIILVGNPNTGKTTLFNTMTKSNQKASNWHGVTVGTISKNYEYEGEKFCVTDVPGMYSLSGYSNEEKIASDYLTKHKDDIVINICDANNLKRNLILTSELIENGFHVIVVVNMFKEVSYDYKKLAELLGVRLFAIDARKKSSVDELKSIVFDIFKHRNYGSEKICKTINPDEVYNMVKGKDADGYKRSNKIDKFLLKKPVFFPLFLCIIFAVFFVTFGPVGETLLGGVEFVLSKILLLVSKFLSSIHISTAVRTFLVDGLLNSAFTVLSFVPQIVLLMFFLNLLEDTGYMSRVAFMFDGMLKKIGLTGKSLFSLMMGFGCTTSAVLTTRNLENQNLRKRTALLLPFASCTAKLPIFLVISSLFFENYKFLFVFLLYIFGIVIGLVFACIYKKAIPEKTDLFILEMPKFRFPNFKKITKDTLTVIADFLVRVGTLIMLFTSLVWVLQNFSCSFKFLNGEHFESSILYFLSSKLLFVFKPIGIESAGAVAAILIGLVAKELVVVGLCLINGTSGSLAALSQSLLSPVSPCHFTPTSAVVFLIFILLYSPCISALMAVKNEFGRKFALYVFSVQFLLSFVICFVANICLKSPIFAILILGIMVLALITRFVIKLIYKNKGCGRNCNECGKICKQKKSKTV